MQIRPQGTPSDTLCRLQKVVMVVPVDADVYEAQNVAAENGKDRLEIPKTGPVRRLHFQHHDGDDYGKHTVTESLHAALGHHFALPGQVASSLRLGPCWNAGLSLTVGRSAMQMNAPITSRHSSRQPAGTSWESVR